MSRFYQPVRPLQLNRAHPLALGLKYACCPGIPMGFSSTVTSRARDHVWGGFGTWNTGSPSIGLSTLSIQDAGRGITVENFNGAGTLRVTYAATNNRFDISAGLSVAVLMRPRATYSGGQQFFGKTTAFGAGTEDWIIGAEAGSLYYWQIANAAGTENFVDSTTAQSTSRTDLVVGTYDGANLRIYVNGKIEGTPTASTLVVANNAAVPITFGPFSGGGETLIDYFMGAMWNRTLSAQEIARLYSDPFAMWKPTTAGRAQGFVAAVRSSMFLSY